MEPERLPPGDNVCAYWCLGETVLTVIILMVLIKTLGLTELVSDVLGSRKQKEAETNTKIVDLFKDALDEIKNYRTEQQRVEFHIALSCVMPNLVVEGCTRTKQTFWTEDQFVVTASSGIRNRDTRVTEIVSRELQKDKPGKWGCVQDHDLWSSKEETHVCPGHH